MPMGADTSFVLKYVFECVENTLFTNEIMYVYVIRKYTYSIPWAHNWPVME
jgi:hypothetical protein